MEKKNQSIETDSEPIQMLELAYKDIQIVFMAILHIYRDIKNVKKIQSNF